MTQEPIEKDIAIVRIPQLKGRKRIAGYPLHLEAARSSDETVYMQTGGYPSDKDAGTFWFTSCRGDLDTQYAIFHTSCDVIPGQSGSAVVQVWSPKELEGQKYPVPNKPTLIGVVAATSKHRTFVSAFTQDQIDQIHGMIGKTDHHHNAFQRFRVRRNLEHRLFVDNRCDRDIDIFSQMSVSENSQTKRITKGGQIGPLARAQLLSSTFASVDIFIGPSEIHRVNLYRESDPREKRSPIGPLRKIFVESENASFDGYRFELGDVWTDARLVLECNRSAP